MNSKLDMLDHEQVIILENIVISILNVGIGGIL